MTVTYFDECKDDPAQGRDWYLVGGLPITMQNIPVVENLVSDIAADVFGTRELTPQTEFHGRDIYGGKAAFKGKSIGERLAIFERLIRILEDDTLLRRVYAAVKTDELKLYDRAPRYAFAHFIERLQLSLGKEELSILIGDLDDQQCRQMVSDFAQFRETGTPWDYGVKIDKIAGSVNFVRSHHSRLVQLADVYVFITVDQFAPRGGNMGDEFRKLLAGRNLYAHRYKHWRPSA